MSYTGLMQQTALIQRATPTADERGIVSSIWADLAAAVPCRLDTLSESEVLTARGWCIEAQYRLLLPPSVVIRSNPPDRVVIDGTHYLVVAVDPGRGKTLTALLQRQ